jgi:DNA-binding IclR family transcriptional regulator
LTADALPMMSRLARQTLQSSHTDALDSSQAVITAQTNAFTDIGFYVRLGSQVDIMESSSGYVILPHMET